MDKVFDYIVVGGGIVGLSTAWQLQQRFPDKSVLLLEKESRLAAHQTGHNSGVIHSGIYYDPDSLKARFCREGLHETIRFCEAHGIAYEQCGKLLVATDAPEKDRMLRLFERSRQNQIETELLSAEQLKALEPNVNGVGAIRVHATGIVDYAEVCEKMAQCFVDAGGEIRLNTFVESLEENEKSIRLSTANGSIATRFLICCAGLMADRLARMLQLPIDFSIIPYRGEYYQLDHQKTDLIRHLIYPIPDPALPFLGIHLTRMIDGTITVGPNAVQGWKREGYGRINFSLNDTLEMLAFPGFWRVIRKHASSAVDEVASSLSKERYLKKIQKYCPSVTLADLKPYPAGIRAQAVKRDGTLVHDFLFAQSRRSLHVCNAPSPAATSAIPIGRYIVEKVTTASAGLKG